MLVRCEVKTERKQKADEERHNAVVTPVFQKKGKVMLAQVRARTQSQDSIHKF